MSGHIHEQQCRCLQAVNVPTAAAASAFAGGTRPRLTRLLRTGGQGYNNHHNRCEDSTPSISIGHQHKTHSTAKHGNISKTKPIQKKQLPSTYCDGNFVLFQSILEALHLETCRFLLLKVSFGGYGHK